jgi:hypothetical protein
MREGYTLYSLYFAVYEYLLIIDHSLSLHRDLKKFAVNNIYRSLASETATAILESAVP